MTIIAVTIEMLKAVQEANRGPNDTPYVKQLHRTAISTATVAVDPLKLLQ